MQKANNQTTSGIGLNIEAILEKLNEKCIQLEIANQRLASIRYAFDHTLQEPMRKIQILCDLALKKDQGNLSDESREFFERIMRTSNNLQALVKDMLEYFNIDEITEKKQLLSLTTIIDSETSLWQKSILPHKAVVSYDNLHDIMIKPVQFGLLVNNILSNAIKFSSHERTPYVIIKSKMVEEEEVDGTMQTLSRRYCRISVQDNGVGFNNRYKDYIFGFYNRLDRKREGTGMGLAICKKIAENHNGFIVATGEENNGAQLDIYIPA